MDAAEQKLGDGHQSHRSRVGTKGGDVIRFLLILKKKKKFPSCLLSSLPYYFSFEVYFLNLVFKQSTQVKDFAAPCKDGYRDLQ